jgi:DNA repair exonuclease SbcCD ATPase subunit
MTVCRIVPPIAVMAAFAVGQQLSVLPPREIDKARAKVEAAWAAWHTIPRPEAGLLNKNPKQALAEIDRSETEASRYLDAKAEFFTRVSEAFHHQVEQIRMEDDHVASSGLTPGERQRVEALLERERTTRQRIGRAESKADRPIHQELESIEREEKDLVRLQDEIHDRIGILDQIAQDEEDARTARANLIDHLNEIVAILGGRVEAVEAEKAQWQAYHERLRELVIEREKK